MNSGCAAALDRLQDFCFMAIKAANREPCTPPRSTLILTPAFVVYTELGIDPHATVYRQFKKLLKQVDVTPIRFHDTRHIFAFLSFASGADPVTTQEQLGHATAKFTQEVYAYSPDERKQRAASAISAYIASNLKAQ